MSLRKSEIIFPLKGKGTIESWY